MQEEKNNDKLKVISVDELRQFEGMENLSIEDVELAINMIKKLTLITHNFKSKYEPTQSIPKLRKV